MGVVVIGRRLTADEFRAVLEDASVVDSLIYGDLEDEDAEMPDPDIDLDKSWHGIHYLLAHADGQTCHGACEAILGGEEVGEDPATVLPGCSRLRLSARSPRRWTRWTWNHCAPGSTRPR